MMQAEDRKLHSIWSNLIHLGIAVGMGCLQTFSNTVKHYNNNINAYNFLIG